MIMWDDGCSLTVILFHVYLFIYLTSGRSCCFTMKGVLAHVLPFSSFCSIWDFSIDGSKKTLTLSNCVFSLLSISFMYCNDIKELSASFKG